MTRVPNAAVPTGRGQRKRQIRSPWGKYKGQKLSAVGTGYLYCVAREAEDKELREEAKRIIQKRKKGQKRYQALDPYYLWVQVKRIAGKVGLEMTTHTFRHTHAETLNKAGWSIPEIQGSLGHRSQRTTEVYLHSLTPRSRKAGKAVQKAIKMAT